MGYFKLVIFFGRVHRFKKFLQCKIIEKKAPDNRFCQALYEMTSWVYKTYRQIIKLTLSLMAESSLSIRLRKPSSSV